MKIMIVDDDALVCQSLEVLFSREADMEVSAIASDGKEAIDVCLNNLPDVILMDIQMPNMDGIQATREIKRRWEQVRIMMLTTFKDEDNIRLALRAGAEGYMLKSTPATNMAQQIRVLVSGSSVLDADVLKTITRNQDSSEDMKILTNREQDILELIAQGHSNKEIASQLFISEGRVRNTLSIVLSKLDLRDRTQLAIYYWKRN
ncbi:DNA-binding NarL/FixJ family response regulator [Virgibacillus natechei]|uniref:DNA-binding NarL/FixJ family response regulator n=1 Tax=Virgibacillus natechei TaxID=1216297 RepID=A0ABS4IDR4_9BACI|nr:response regulator transcription factor [Virgibacillus natechei]MBP1969087.1 DNA-binding NarL/FixJ family response regulator [Virgibacillus natechei]UZD14354.1 response regulator transcription factor [Virgibacillus natechei]